MKAAVILMVGLVMMSSAFKDKISASQPDEARIRELVAQLSDKDPEVAKKAEEALARLGPEHIPLIRKLSPNCMLVVMYDKLTMKPQKGKITWSTCYRAAEEALKYFESLKATGYIVLGLLSEVWDVRSLTLASLRKVAFLDENSKKVAVAGIVNALEKQPVELQGEENVTIDQIIKRKEIELLSILTGEKFDIGRFIMPEDVQRVIMQCKKWLEREEKKSQKK